jgi:lysyl-tRNA synthetase class 1
VLEKARIWAEKYAPEADRIVVQENIDRNAVSILSPAQRKALREFGEKLKAQRTEKQIFDACFEAAKSSGLKPQEFFQAAYLAILGRERGPRLASLILSAGREKIAQLLEKV